MTSWSLPGGAHPYSAEINSKSVPQIPSSSARTNISPSLAGGSGTSLIEAELAFPGEMVSAFMSQFRNLLPLK
jgi:hypothetical protein